MKKSVIKKLITLGVITSMLTASLIGCGSTASSDKAETSSSTPSSTVASAAASTVTAPEETANLIWYIVGDKAKDQEKVMTDLNAKLKNKINVTLDLRVLGWGEYNDQMKLISNSQQDYDLCFTSSWTNSFVDNVARGALLDITDLYAEYGKDIKGQIVDYLINAGMSKGKIYAIPNQQILAGQTGFGIQTEYLKKYNTTVDDLKTMEGLEAFMTNIAKNEPTKIAINNSQPILVSDYENIANGVVIKKDDSTFKCLRGDDPALQNELRMRNEWFKKGFIRKDIATKSDVVAEFAANKFIVLNNGFKPGVAAEYTSSYKTEFSEVAWGQPRAGIGAGSGTMTGINVNSKNPVAAMKLINLVYSDKEIFNELVWGLENVHYKKVGDNRIEPIKDSGYGYPDWELGNVFNGYITPGKPDDVWEVTDKMNKTAEVSRFLDFSFDPTPVQSQLAQLSAVQGEFLNQEYVTKDIEALLKQMYDKDTKAGIDAIVAEVQKQIDAWAATKK